MEEDTSDIVLVPVADYINRLDEILGDMEEANRDPRTRSRHLSVACTKLEDVVDRLYRLKSELEA